MMVQPTRRPTPYWRRVDGLLPRYITRRIAASPARNFLIDRSSGEYLCALDADDKLHPRYFERTLATFEREPSLAFVSSWLQMFGAEDRIWPRDSRCDLETLLCHDPIFSAALVRRSAVVAAGGYDENMPAQGDEDWDLWISLIEAGHAGVILPEILFYYRRRRGSMCDLCTTGRTHLDLVEYLVHKHLDSYRAHVPEVLLWKEVRLDEQRAANARLERELVDHLEPALERRGAELTRLKNVLEECRRQPVDRGLLANAVAGFTSNGDRADFERLRAEHQRCLSEIVALRTSVSWKCARPHCARHTTF